MAVGIRCARTDFQPSFVGIERTAETVSMNASGRTEISGMKFKHLQKYQTGGSGDRMELSFPLPRTPEGRVYRYSPNELAYPRHFVLGEIEADFCANEAAKLHMKLEPHSPQTVCPYSGVVGDDNEFTHPSDVEAAFKAIKHAALSDAEESFRDLFKGLSRNNSRNKFIRIETKTTSTPRPKPRFSRQDLIRQLVCNHCGRDYGVFAIGLFCPDCGAPNLSLHFAREVELVTAQVKIAELQRTEHQELAYRLLGNAHEDVLTALEATLKTVYVFGAVTRSLTGVPVKPVKNDFQNIETAGQRFTELKIALFENLSEAELGTLKLNIQKRHIIGHNLGVMDTKFAEHAVNARIGETIQIVGDDILKFAALGQRIVDQLDDWLNSVPLHPHELGARIEQNH